MKKKWIAILRSEVGAGLRLPANPIPQVVSALAVLGDD